MTDSYDPDLGPIDEAESGARDATDFNTDVLRAALEERVSKALRANVDAIRTAAAHHTPVPQVGDVWRARWAQTAGAVLITYVDHHLHDASRTGAKEAAPTTAHWATQEPISALRVAPVSFDEEPDDSAVLAPAFAHDLGFDIAVWVDDEADLPTRVLECKLGQFTHSGVEGLPRGSRNWGPSDPRTLARAHVQDLVEDLAEATWAPDETAGVALTELLGKADIRDVAAALGSVPAAMQLRRGQTPLSVEQAKSLAPVLSVDADTLLAASRRALPEDLVAVMDQPGVRPLLDRLAARNEQDELTTRRTAAYGVLALAAREHTRAAGTNWAARLRAYLDGHLAASDEPGDTPGAPGTPRSWGGTWEASTSEEGEDR